MYDPIDLKQILDAAIGKVELRKLEQLKRKLEDALGGPLSSQIVDDPIIIRRLLVEKLRSEGVSPGVIHSFEQLFMGIIRRAAINGLLPAPPEGPWTRAWQSVLDIASTVQKAKAPLRSLAAWATARDLTPANLEEYHIISWCKDLQIDRDTSRIVEQILSQSRSAATPTILISDALHSDRLQKKFLSGTVN